MVNINKLHKATFVYIYISYVVDLSKKVSIYVYFALLKIELEFLVDLV